MFNVNATRAGLLLTLGLALAGCPGPVVRPTPAEPLDAAPRAALQTFLAAQQQGDYTRAYALLAAPLRARYTPERLQRDYVRDHDLANDKLARIQAALSSGVPLHVSDGQALLPLGADRAARLVEEDGQWQIAALE